MNYVIKGSVVRGFPGNGLVKVRRIQAGVQLGLAMLNRLLFVKQDKTVYP